MTQSMQPVLPFIRRYSLKTSERRFFSQRSNERRQKLFKFSHRSRVSVYWIPFYCAILLGFYGLYKNYNSMGILETIQRQPEKLQDSEHYPVLNDADPNRYSNTPVSRFRPRNQFSDSDATAGISSNDTASSEESILSVLTVTQNPSDPLKETADFIRQQSLRPISWIIVNDHSNSDESIQLLKSIAESDIRVSLLNSSFNAGFTSGRLAALDYLLHHPTKYFTFLDDDDMYELTGYEKCVWMLESNENISMCGSYVVRFGEKNYTFDRGFHNDQSVHFKENAFTGSEVLRTDILKTTNCTLNTRFDGQLADRDLYLCFLKQRKWGATIPEPLFWQRQNPSEVRNKRWGDPFLHAEEETGKFILSRYKPLNRSFPDISPQFSMKFQRIPTHVPFENPLNLKQSVLLIISSMTRSSANTANINLVHELSRRGYRVTIVCTLLDVYKESMLSRPYFMQYTHDVFFLPGMLRVVDVPRFLTYVIESRGVDLVIISNSQMGYGMLPWLAAKYGDIRFIDYVQDGEAGSKNMDFAMLSTVHEASLDATFTSSVKRRKAMLEKGHSGSSLYLGHQGIDTKGLTPFSEDKKVAMRRELRISPEATVIIYAQKYIDDSAKTALEAFRSYTIKERASSQGISGNELARHIFLLVGDGPKLKELEGLASDQVRFLKAFDHDEDSIINYLGLSDILCLPSLSDDLSFPLAKAMALGVIPLAAQGGGNSELVGKNGVNGVLVPLTGDRDQDVNAFAEEIRKLILNQDLRKSMGKRAAYQVRNMFDSAQNIPDLVDRILSHPRTRLIDGMTGDDMSPLYYAQEHILEEGREFADFLEIQRAIQGKARAGYANRYRMKCGETRETVRLLVDYLENPQPCQAGVKIDVESLQKNAIEQCGQWCIMDLSDEKRISGWRGDERCGGFYTFNDENHECSQSYHDNWGD